MEGLVEQEESCEALSGESARRHFGAIEVDYDDVAAAEGFRERFLRGGG